VAKGSNWPGVWLFRSGHSQTVQRPYIYFRKDGDMPDEISFTISPPPHLGYHSQEVYEKLVEEQLFRREQKIAAKMAAKGQQFFGVRAIMKQRPTASPKNREPRRELNPRVAARSKRLRIDAIQRNKDFLAEYQKARKRWLRPRIAATAITISILFVSQFQEACTRVPTVESWL
jgi:putative transposase